MTKLLGQQQRRCDSIPPPLSGALHRHGAVRRLLVATFVLFLAFNVFYVIFPVRADAKLGWSPGMLGAFFTVLSVALVVCEGPVLTASAKRFSPIALFVAGTALLALSFGAFMSRASSLIFAGAVVFALGNGIAWPTFQARIADAAGVDAQGEVQGAAASASSLASIVGLVAGGILWTWFGRSLFVAAALLFLVLGAGARLFFPRKRG